MNKTTSDTLEVKVANAIKAYNSADKTGKKLLSDLFPGRLDGNITDRIKTFEDVCAEAGKDPADYVLPAGASDDEIGANAFRKLQLVFRVFNGDWKADYNNSNQYKYYPYFKSSGSGFAFGGYGCDDALAYVGARLSTKSEALARYIGTQFIDIYNEFLTIN